MLKRNFYHKEKTAELKNEADGEQLSVEFGDLSMLLGELGGARMKIPGASGRPER
ncbi:MAG: hypothetical protein V8S31_09280 [Lachnospiraceae bacterium]